MKITPNQNGKNKFQFYFIVGYFYLFIDYYNGNKRELIWHNCSKVNAASIIEIIFFSTMVMVVVVAGNGRFVWLIILISWSIACLRLVVADAAVAVVACYGWSFAYNKKTNRTAKWNKERTTKIVYLIQCSIVFFAAS